MTLSQLAILLGAGIAHVAEDNLDGLGQLARSNDLPNFAIPPGADPLNQAVSGNGFRAFREKKRHNA